jgi:hypothetical protein
METIVVTRHPALVAYLEETGIIKAGCPVTAHASPEQVQGKHVIGVLPPQFLILAQCVTVVPLSIPPELRGTELTLEQIRSIAGKPFTFEAREVPTP